MNFSKSPLVAFFLQFLVNCGFIFPAIKSNAEGNDFKQDVSDSLKVTLVAGLAQVIAAIIDLFLEKYHTDIAIWVTLFIAVEAALETRNRKNGLKPSSLTRKLTEKIWK